MTTSKGGRPPQYSREQLDAAIDILAARGQPVQPVAVKAALCEEFNLSPGINLQSLARELDACLDERAETRRREAVAMLPEAAVAGVRSQVGLLERELLGALGRIRADLAQEAGKEAAARAAECRHLAARCDELEQAAQADAERRADLDREVAALIAERDAARARAAAAEAEVRASGEREAARGSVRDEVRAEVAHMLAALGQRVRPDGGALSPVAEPSSKESADLSLLEDAWPSCADVCGRAPLSALQGATGGAGL